MSPPQTLSPTGAISMKIQKRDTMRLEYTCVLCKAKVQGWGNNPWPLANEGKCCEVCNRLQVLPARLARQRDTDGQAVGRGAAARPEVTE